MTVVIFLPSGDSDGDSDDTHDGGEVCTTFGAPCSRLCTY